MQDENERFERYRDHIEKAAVEKYRQQLLDKVISTHGLLERMNLSPKEDSRITVEELTAIRYGAMHAMTGIGGFLLEALAALSAKNGDDEETVESIRKQTGLNTESFTLASTIIDSAVTEYVREVVDAEE